MLPDIPSPKSLAQAYDAPQSPPDNCMGLTLQNQFRHLHPFHSIHKTSLSETSSNDYRLHPGEATKNVPVGSKGSSSPPRAALRGPIEVFSSTPCEPKRSSPRPSVDQRCPPPPYRHAHTRSVRTVTQHPNGLTFPSNHGSNWAKRNEFLPNSSMK